MTAASSARLLSRESDSRSRTSTLRRSWLPRLSRVPVDVQVVAGGGDGGAERAQRDPRTLRGRVGGRDAPQRQRGQRHDECEQQAPGGPGGSVADHGRRVRHAESASRPGRGLGQPSLTRVREPGTELRQRHPGDLVDLDVGVAELAAGGLEQVVVHRLVDPPVVGDEPVVDRPERREDPAADAGLLLDLADRRRPRRSRRPRGDPWAATRAGGPGGRGGRSGRPGAAGPSGPRPDLRRRSPPPCAGPAARRGGGAVVGRVDGASVDGSQVATAVPVGELAAAPYPWRPCPTSRLHRPPTAQPTPLPPSARRSVG